MKQSKGQRSKPHKTRVPLGLATKYQRDFDHKDSGDAPEVVRRLVIAIQNSSVATTGSVVYSAANASGVVNAPEFTAIANQGIYRNFRVVAMRVRVVAIFAAPISPTFQGMGPLIGAVCGGNNVPPNDNRGLLSSQGFRVSREQLPYLELKVDAGCNKNALLWSTVNTGGTSVLPPANNLSVGWRFTRAADALYNGKTVTDEFYEYDVEFSTAG